MQMERQSTITPRDLEHMLLDKTADPKALSLSLLEKITDRFSDEQQIGSGAFAVVYKGKLENGTVAVKRMSNTYMYEKEFQREVECLMIAKHKNVVRFLGYCSDTQGSMERFDGKFVMADVQQRMLCFEYLPKGSLHEYITDTSRRLRWRDLYQIITGICQGLHYLHQKNILHLDLKPANILLDDSLVPKIADFGISRCFDQMESQVISKISGTPGYLAPESFNHSKITYRNSYKLDIYSLGVVIIEILTGRKGYHDIDKVVESWSHLLEKSQREVHLEQIRVCAEIGTKCTDFNPSMRPDTQHIISRLGETECMGVYTKAGVISSQQVLERLSDVLEESQREVHLEPVRVCAEIGIECTNFDSAERPETQHIITRLFEIESMGICTEAGVITSQPVPEIFDLGHGEQIMRQSSISGMIPAVMTTAHTGHLSRHPSLGISMVDKNQPPRYKLMFCNGLSKVVFTKKRICAENGDPLHICLTSNQHINSSSSLLSAKIKIVVLDGDFSRDSEDRWTSEDFRRHIVRPRDKAGVVLTGELELTLKNGEADLRDATFIDNSTFVRSGMFRLGVMAVDELGERVLEGMTETFTVKHRRGEGSQKHIVPTLDDDVWRLKKISKNGVFHEALKLSNIFFVKDFLRSYYKDEQSLRRILTSATKVWTTIVEHAKMCDPGKELYSFVVEGRGVVVFFNSVYQIIGVTTGDQYTTFSDLDKLMQDEVREWTRDAYGTLAYRQPDHEMENGKPRSVSRSISEASMMLEPLFLQGHQHKRKFHQTDDEKSTSGSHSEQRIFKSVGSIRPPNNDDVPFDISFYAHSGSERYWSFDDDIRGLVIPFPNHP